VKGSRFFVIGALLVTIGAAAIVDPHPSSARLEVKPPQVTPRIVQPGGSVVISAVRPSGALCAATAVSPAGKVFRRLPSVTVRGNRATWRLQLSGQAVSGVWTALVTCAKSPSSAGRFAVARQNPGVVIAAAGDVACSPADTDFADGNGTGTRCMQGATGQLLATISGLKGVLSLGDQQYPCGEEAKFEAAYAPAWGSIKSIEHPVPGNHEYGDAPGCVRSHGAGYYAYYGARAGNPARGYYSYDLGDWHFIALNSNCWAVGGCQKGSKQESWLHSDLSRHRAVCTLAYWHEPRFSSGDVGDNSAFEAFWDDLSAYEADVVLNGHAHVYERFAPQTPLGHADPVAGVREFVVGTGGEEHHGLSARKPNSQVLNADTFGILKMTLSPTGYSWQFLPIAGQAFTDSGSGQCQI
jgi:hypothetical protein